MVIDAIKRQASRKKIMEQYCQTNSYEKEPRVSRENLGYIILNDEYKFIYCTIPKVGTTTWKNVFAEMRGLRHNVKVHTLESPQLGHRFLCSLGFVGHLFLWLYAWAQTPSSYNVHVVVQFFPWFKFYFPLFLGMVMYDNEF